MWQGELHRLTLNRTRVPGYSHHYAQHVPLPLGCTHKKMSASVSANHILSVLHELVYESMQLVLFLTFSFVHRCLPLQLIWFTGEWRLLFTLSARVTCMSSHRTPPLACMLTVYGLLHIFCSLVRSLERVCLHVLVLVFVRSFVRSCCYVRFGRSFVRLVNRSVVQSFFLSIVLPFILLRYLTLGSFGRSFVHLVNRSVVQSFLLSMVGLFDRWLRSLSVVRSLVTLVRSFVPAVYC